MKERKFPAEGPDPVQDHSKGQAPQRMGLPGLLPFSPENEPDGMAQSASGAGFEAQYPEYTETIMGLMGIGDRHGRKACDPDNQFCGKGLQGQVNWNFVDLNTEFSAFPPVTC